MLSSPRGTPNLVPLESRSWNCLSPGGLFIQNSVDGFPFFPQASFALHATFAYATSSSVRRSSRNPLLDRCFLGPLSRPKVMTPVVFSLPATLLLREFLNTGQKIKRARPRNLPNEPDYI